MKYGPKGAGETVTKGDTLMMVVPSRSFQVEFEVPEADLFLLEEGQAVSMELLWDNAAEKNYTGVITGISHMNEDPKEGSDKKLYKAYASFEADERIRLGMTMLIYPVDNTEKTEEPEE